MQCASHCDITVNINEDLREGKNCRLSRLHSESSTVKVPYLA
jgi:hypothetical protein